MRILMFGDAVGETGTACFQKTAPQLKREYKADLVIVNGENSAKGNGITQHSAQQLFEGGADVITTGNHCFRRRCPEIFEHDRILRPANYPEGAPGKGVCILDCGAYRFAVVNLMGTAFMEPLDNPFSVIDAILPTLGTNNILVDFHAEATSEKRAMGIYLKGKVSAVIGTHTEYSVLGVHPEPAIEKQRFHTPVQFTEATGSCMIGGVLLEIDTKSGICNKIERIFIRESTKSC